MSGHSKWSTIKRKKGALDAKRGAVFTKLGNLIAIAAKEKGGDISSNFTLKMAVDKAKAANMPKDNIERAIKRGTGELEGEQIEELIYEGIGPMNSQFVLKVLTDNKNRSAQEIRHLFTKVGGSLGAVMWNFDIKGVVSVSQEKFKMTDDDELELIEGGAEDINKEEEGVTIITSVSGLQSVKKFFDDKEIEVESADIEYIAKDKIELEDSDREKFDNFVELIEENEDVADYYTNIQ